MQSVSSQSGPSGDRPGPGIGHGVGRGLISGLATTARALLRNVLDRFAIDFSLCMYCGICIEVCPFDALFWSPEFEYAEFDIRDLTHEKDRLQEWMWTVPPPAAVDPNGETPKEVLTAQAPPGDRAAAARTARERPARQPRRPEPGDQSRVQA